MSLQPLQHLTRSKRFPYENVPKDRPGHRNGVVAAASGDAHAVLQALLHARGLHTTQTSEFHEATHMKRETFKMSY